VRQEHLRAARPTENASETPAGRQADGKFTLPSRFALYKGRVNLMGLLITSVSRELQKNDCTMRSALDIKGRLKRGKTEGH
jgi:hypothetical protein